MHSECDEQCRRYSNTSDSGGGIRWKCGTSADQSEFLSGVSAGGSEFDPNSYLTQIKEYDKVKQVVFSENVADPDNQISITQIYVESGVDIYTPGVYTVSYLYTSPASGLDCTAKLIVVVE